MKQKNIRILTWFNFFTDFKLYAPVLIIYFARITGSYALGTSIFAIGSVASALFEIPTGIFSDKIGRKNTVICGALAAVLSAVFLAIGKNFWILVIAALLDGLSISFYSGNNDALLHDTLAQKNEEHEYAEHYGKITAMFQIALGISAILGSMIASWSFALIVWLSVIPQLVCLYLSYQLVEPTIHSQRSGNTYVHLKDAYRNFIHNKKLRWLTLSSMVGYAFGEAGYQFQAAFYTTLWPIWAIGIAKTGSNVGAAFGFRFGGKLIKKFGEKKILFADNLYNRFIGIIATVFPTVISPILMTSTSIFFGVSSTAKNVLFQKEFTSEQRATMGSLSSFAGSIFFGVVVFLLGFIADKFSPAKAFLLLNLVQFMNLFFYRQLFQNEKHR